MFSISIVFLLTNIFNFFKKSLKFQMFKFLSLVFVRFTKSHWKSRWFSKNFCRNFPTFRRPTTSLVSRRRRKQKFIHSEFVLWPQKIVCLLILGCRAQTFSESTHQNLGGVTFYPLVHHDLVIFAFTLEVFVLNYRVDFPLNTW